MPIPQLWGIGGSADKEISRESGIGGQRNFKIHLMMLNANENGIIPNDFLNYPVISIIERVFIINQ